VHKIALAGELLQMGDLALNQNLYTSLFGKVQIVFVERILGTDRTTGESATAKGTPLPLRALPREVGIGMCMSRGAEKYALRHRPKSRLCPHPGCCITQPAVLQTLVRVDLQA